MSEAVVDDIVAVLPPLLQSLEALSFVARHLHPPDFDRVMQAAGTPDQALQSVRERLADWPAEVVGNGRGFLWSWLRDARSLGAILVAPTATGPTWALMGEDTDTPNLARILDSVRARWNVDPEKMLMTGMSDGGTFCYVSGLDGSSP